MSSKLGYAVFIAFENKLINMECKLIRESIFDFSLAAFNKKKSRLIFKIFISNY